MISFKKKIQQISNITLISIVLLISINFLLGWVWEIRTNIKFKNLEPYDEIVRKSLSLNKKDALILFFENHQQLHTLYRLEKYAQDQTHQIDLKQHCWFAYLKLLTRLAATHHSRLPLFPKQEFY